MKTTVYNFAVLVAFAMAFTGFALAQDDTYHVTAKIPFEFYIGDQQIPAGTYLFNVSYGAHSVTMRNHDTGQTYTVLAVPADGHGLTLAELEFDIVGGNHLLADLRTTSTGVNFHESRSLLHSAQRRGSIAIVAELR